MAGKYIITGKILSYLVTSFEIYRHNYVCRNVKKWQTNAFHNSERGLLHRLLNYSVSGLEKFWKYCNNKSCCPFKNVNQSVNWSCSTSGTLSSETNLRVIWMIKLLYDKIYNTSKKFTATPHMYETYPFLINLNRLCKCMCYFMC